MKRQMILKIYGKVQGVFFRSFCQKKARELNLSGWASNEPDGSVRVVAEGEEKDLKELFEWCKQGPNYAKVEKVDTEWLDFKNQFDDFEVR